MSPSLQLRATDWYIRRFVRRSSWGEPEALARRARRIFGSPSLWAHARSFGVRVHPVDEPGVGGEWLIPRHSLRGTIFYIHGGGYVACSPETHRPLTAALARLSRRRVFSLDYRLAPEHRFPAAFDDAVAAYRWIVSHEEPGSIVVAGDSAGGGLALALLAGARDAGLPLPSCAVLYSAWTDMEGDEESAIMNRGRCTMFTPHNIHDFAAAYLGTASRADPRASPALGNLSGLPPILLQVGESELLLNDSARVHERIRQTGGQSELEIWPDVFHGWQMLDGIMPEARRAIDQSVAFMISHFKPSGA